MTDDAFALTPEEVASFKANGFIGPFDLYDDAPLRWDKAKVEMVLSANPPHDSTINYDRHLDCSVLSEHVGRPEVVHRLRSLMGDDILCWRTEIFKKDPGESGTGWHQVETFVMREENAAGKTASLQFTEENQHVTQELTVWASFSPVAIEHGPLRFIQGSHKQWYYAEGQPMTYQPTRKTHDFFGYDWDEIRLDPDWNPDEQDCTTMVMGPGQFVIFVAKCVHGSLPNVSDTTRLGLSSRYVAPSVRVYDGIDRLVEFGTSIDLSRHSSVLVSGQDDYGYNRISDTNLNGVPYIPPVPRHGAVPANAVGSA